MALSELGYGHHRDLTEDILSALDDAGGSMWLSDLAEDMAESVPDLVRCIDRSEDVTLNNGRVVDCRGL